MRWIRRFVGVAFVVVVSDAAVPVAVTAAIGMALVPAVLDTAKASTRGAA